MCTICVMTFFLISGFFIYNKKGTIIGDWVKLLKNFFLTVFIPFFVIVLISLVFQEYFVSNKTISECIKSIDLNFIRKSLYESFILHFSTNYLPGTSAHLWYIFSYATIIFVYPITRFILKNCNKMITYIILLIFLILMVTNDYLLYHNNPYVNFFFVYVPKPIFYSAWGHVLYNDVLKPYIDDKNNTKSKKQKLVISKPLLLIGIALYIISFITLFFTQCAYYINVNNDYVYTSWLSTFSLIMTTGFIIVVYSINFERFFNDNISKAICFIASKTFGIYLVHYPIVTKLFVLGVQSTLKQNYKYIWQHIFYHIYYSLFIFIISFIIVCIVDYIVAIVVKIFTPKEVLYD